MQRTNDELYARMGMAALLPGMLRAAEILNAEIEQFRAALAEPAPNKRGRPPGRSAWHKNFWANMTPAQRKAEVQRRMNVRKQNKAKKVKAAAVNPVSEASKSYWAKMTEKQRKAEMARRVAKRQALRKDSTEEERKERRREIDRASKQRIRAAKKAAKVVAAKAA